MSEMAATEFHRHVTGAGQFTDDLQLEGVLHGQVLRSPYAHAELAGIDMEAALVLPGVVAVFTGADLERDGVGSIPCLWPVEQADGSPLVTPAYPPLALGRVRHVGDAVALVVAETRHAAIDGAERIEVDYQPLPSVTDGADALSEQAPRVWPEAPQNICFQCEFGDAAATQAAFADAATIVKRRLEFPRVLASTLETRAALAVPDERSITLYTQTQGAQYFRGILAGVLGLEMNELYVVTPDVGGSFGMKAFPYPEQVFISHAARRLGRPVKWVAERSSDGFLGDNHARDLVYDAEIALDSSGQILGLRVRTVANLGAYISCFAPLNSTAVSRIPGPYHLPTAHVSVTGVFTNTLPVDAYRGAARSEAFFLMERMVDAAAHELGVDPSVLRRRNFARTTEAMRTNCFDYAIEHRDYDLCLDDALARFDWPGRKKRRAEGRGSGRLRGFGLACYAATTMPGPEEVRMEIDTSGLVSVMVATQSSGQGHETAVCATVGEALSVDPGRVRLVQGDTRRYEFESMTGGSRTIACVLPACERAASVMIERGKSVCAALLQTNAARITYRDGMFLDAESGTHLDFKDLVSAAADAGLADGSPDHCLASVGSFDAESATFPSGTHVCEVEIDPETGKVFLLRYLSVDDIGRVLTPRLAPGQVHGAVAQGFGQAIIEACVYDRRTGQLLSGSFLDYALPRADNLPNFEVFFRDDGDSQSMRGIGEMGTIASTPAILNAINDALVHIGAEEIEPPATPERIWRACQNARN